MNGVVENPQQCCGLNEKEVLCGAVLNRSLHFAALRSG